MRFNNFMHVCKYSKIRNSRIAKFILRFIEEYNEEKKFEGKESDEQKNIYDLILKKNIDSIFDNETEYNIIIKIERQLMDYLFIKNYDFIYHYIEIYYNEYMKMFLAFLLADENINKNNIFCDRFYKFLLNENKYNLI